MLHSKQCKKFTKMIEYAEKNVSLNWLFVMPRITQFDDQQYIFPIGIAYVSSALKASRRNVFTLNLNYKKENNFELIKKMIMEHDIDVVATGGLTTQYPLLKEILDAAKQIKPSITTVTGGGIITSEPVPAMIALESADYGIIGEGELTVCELADALEIGSDIDLVQGIVHKKNGEWTITPPREEINDLDKLPWPDYDGFDYEELLSKTPLDKLTAESRNERVGFVFYSRSCPYQCTFCFHSSGKKYRTRSIDSFFAEFDWLMERFSLNSFLLADEYFLRNLEFVREFCRRIKPYKIRWACAGRVDNITKEMLEILLDAGCYQIAFGVESVNDHILKSMRKHITRAQIENAFELCHEVGMEAQGNLIFGDLEETVETAMNSINWWREHQNWMIPLKWIITYPGTYIYQVARERGLIPDPVEFIKQGCPEINFSKMTDEERRHIAAVIEMLVSENHEVLSNAVISAGQTGKVTVKGDCPYCDKTGTFLNLDPIRPWKLEVCSKCGHTLRLYASDYMNAKVVDDNVNTLLRQHKIALWPVIPGVGNLLARIPALADDGVVIVDSSPYKQGVELCGKIVQSPNTIRDNEVDIVFVTTTTPVSFEIIDRIQKDFPGVKRVGLIGELFFPLIN